MSKYIDSDELIKELEHCSYETWSKGVNREWWAQAVKVKDNIVQCIQRQPTADVVEVVRCKDCKHYEIDEEGFGCCGNSTGYDAKDYTDFCSYAERRAEE